MIFDIPGPQKPERGHTRQNLRPALLQRLVGDFFSFFQSPPNPKDPAVLKRLRCSKFALRSKFTIA